LGPLFSFRRIDVFTRSLLRAFQTAHGFFSLADGSSSERFFYGFLERFFLPVLMNINKEPDKPAAPF